MTPYIEAQRAILSIILNYGFEAFDVANRYLEERHFTELRYKVMWRSIHWLWENDHEITDITVENSMSVTRESGQVCIDLLDPKTGKHKEELQAIKAYRAHENVSHLQSYLDIMLDKFKVGKCYEMAVELVQKSKDGKATAGQLQTVINKYLSVLSERDRKQPQTIVEIGKSLASKIGASIDGNQEIIHTKIPMLDNFIWLAPGNQTVIAGDTGHGKTSLALQIAWNVAKQRRKVVDTDTGLPRKDDNGNEVWEHRRVMLFSLEMRRDDMFIKLCCIENNMTVQNFMKLPPPQQKALITAFVGSLETVAPNLTIEDTAFSLRDIASRVNMTYSSFGAIDLIAVDYLQLVEDTKEGANYRREDEVYRAVSRFFKKMAMKLETHTLLLSQLNKAPADKNGAVIHRPSLDRLFGSSALKQDATHVLFVYREWAVDIKKTVINSESTSSLFINRLILAKHRFGHNQVEIACGFIPYLSYFLPLQVIRDAGLLNSTDINAGFPKLKEFMEIY